MNVAWGGPPTGPCAGFRVVDFSTMISGPLCTMVLGDLGADGIKVEPTRGDSTRLLGPVFQGGLSAILAQFDRNKRSFARIRYLRNPARFTGTPPSLWRHPPRLGEHPDEILAEIGMGAATAAALGESGTVA